MSENEDLICLVDLDGTLVDYEGQLRSDLERMRSPGEPEITYQDLHDTPHPWLLERVKMIKRSPNWYLNLPKFQLGWDVLEMAQNIGYAIHILTKGPRKDGDVWRQKLEYVRQNLDDSVLAHVTEFKGIQYGRVLVDDYPGYLEPWLKRRKRGLAIMPANDGNVNFTHPNVIRYDGTPEKRSLVLNALKAAYTRKGKQAWQELMWPEEFREKIRDGLRAS